MKLPDHDSRAGIVKTWHLLRPEHGALNVVYYETRQQRR